MLKLPILNLNSEDQQDITKEATIAANDFCSQDESAKQNAENMQNCVTAKIAEYSEASTSRRLSALGGGGSSASSSIPTVNSGTPSIGHPHPTGGTVKTASAAPSSPAAATPAVRTVGSKSGSTSSRLKGVSNNGSTVGFSSTGKSTTITVKTGGGATAWNGVCGAILGSCVLGTASGVSNGVWSCAGQNGGSNASCGSVNGACGSTVGACNSGTASTVTNNFTSAVATQTWNCEGINGGTSANNCSATICTIPNPSTRTIACSTNNYGITCSQSASCSTGTLAWTDNPPNVNKCANFHPGMEFRVSDEFPIIATNSIGTLKYYLNQDVHSFNGIVYQINWGGIETSQGVYDWSILDAAFAAAKASGKYFRVKFEDRTYLYGCNSQFIPSYIARDPYYTGTQVCFANIWEQATMDSEIAVLTALVQRYASDPYFSGVIVEETAFGAEAVHANPALYLSLYAQLERLATAVHNAAPNIIFTQYINWPYNGNAGIFPLINNLISSNGGIGWPDSMTADEYTWSWYQFARDDYTKLLIAPSAESGDFTQTTIPAALAAHEDTYQMLVGDLHANIIVWDFFNAAIGSNYFTQVVIPTVNNHNGAVLNNTCPFAAQ